MIRYICDRCDNKQIMPGEDTDCMKPYVIRVGRKMITLHICIKCERNMRVPFGMSAQQIVNHMAANLPPWARGLK